MVKTHIITKGSSHSFCFKSCWNKRATNTHTNIELTAYTQVDKPNGWFYWWNKIIQIKKATLTELELNYILSLSTSWRWCVTFWAEGALSEHILVCLSPLSRVPFSYQEEATLGILPRWKNWEKSKDNLVKMWCLKENFIKKSVIKYIWVGINDEYIWQIQKGITLS